MFLLLPCLFEIFTDRLAAAAEFLLLLLLFFSFIIIIIIYSIPTDEAITAVP